MIVVYEKEVKPAGEVRVGDQFLVAGQIATVTKTHVRMSEVEIEANTRSVPRFKIFAQVRLDLPRDTSFEVIK